MRVLVTGAAGFIGSHVTRALVEQEHEVYAVIRPSSPTKPIGNILDRISVVAVDLLDSKAVERAVGALAPEAAIHLAWYAEPSKYLNDADKNLESLAFSCFLLKALVGAGCRRILVVGTCLEGLPKAPPTIYLAAKRALHSIADGLTTSGVSALCAHIFYLYGPWENEHRAIPTVIRALLEGREIEVTAGEQKRDYLHVADVARGICMLAESSLTGTADVATGEALTLRQVFEAIGRETGRPNLIRFGRRPYDHNEIFSAVGDPAMLRTTGWEPSVSLDDGIRDAVAWWSQQMAEMG